MQRILNRREALKTILAASGGIAAASFIPAKWMHPLVQSGVLPVHAQGSIATCSLPEYDVEFSLDDDGGEYYILFGFTSLPGIVPVTYLVNNVTIDHGALDTPREEYNEFNGPYVNQYFPDGLTHPTKITATVIYNFGAYDFYGQPVDLSNACTYTYTNYSITPLPQQ